MTNEQKNRPQIAEPAGFTPGPWVMCEDGLIDKMVVGGDYDLIIDITHTNGQRNDADASLIAAAPKMYALLEQLQGALEHVPILKAEIEKVLKEARGEK